MTTRRGAADTLFNVATILEREGAAPRLINRYRRAARLLLRADATPGDVDRLGFAPPMIAKLRSLLATAAPASGEDGHE